MSSFKKSLGKPKNSRADKNKDTNRSYSPLMSTAATNSTLPDSSQIKEKNLTPQGFTQLSTKKL